MIGVARFTLNHFFVRAPFLYDAGWLSALVHRAGLIPENPLVAFPWAKSFYSVHFSPIFSLFSLVSYVVPLQRFEWYAVVQALIYMPISVAVYSLWRSWEWPHSARDVAAAASCALAFSFSGMVIALIASPHYEAMIPGLTCLLLAAVVSNRTRLAWACLLLTAAVREDAGFHVALALLPVLALQLRGAEMLPSRRWLIRMVVAAVVASVIATAVQRLAFHSLSMLRHVYIGDPAFAHVTWVALAERLSHFVAERQFIYYPLLVTIAIAVVRRDAGYLLGWVSALPWFALNLLAVDPEKGAFNAYTGFPFVVCMYWVYLYDSRFRPASRRMRPLLLHVVFALVCTSSTVGLYVASPSTVTFNVKEMAFHRSKNRAAVHGFVDALSTHRSALGRLRVDPSVAALALESLRFEDLWQPGVTDLDSLAFHQNTWFGADLALQLFTSRLDACTSIAGTRLVVCSRTPLPPEILGGLSTKSIPPVFAFGLKEGRDTSIDGRGIVLLHRASVTGLLGTLPPGPYHLTISLSTGANVGLVEIVSAKEIVASASTTNDSTEVRVDFVADGKRFFECRVRSRMTSEFIIVTARLREG